VIGVSLKGLAARPVRAVLTSLAIVLGVAMVSGSFVVTDTITKAFDTIGSGACPRSGRRRARSWT
jgi:putative ABC transport system permease protein